MAKTRRNVWNAMVQEERGDTSRLGKDPVEDNPFADELQKQDDARNKNSRERESHLNRSSLEDVLFIHPNDHTNLQLVAVQLSGNNFYTWSRSVKRALGARNKLYFINGNLLEPPIESYYHKAWLKADYMVSTWLMNSMTKDVASAFQYIDDSRTLWEEIINRFDRSSGPKLYQLERDLGLCMQNNLSVMEYFNNINAIWDEINVLSPIPVCSCVICECGADQAMRQLIEKRRLNQFLLGLNDSFETARSQILLTDPLPSVSKAYSLILQDEDQRKATSKLSHISESAMLAKSPQYGGNQRVQRPEFGNFRARLSREERRQLFCTHCGLNEHEINECFKIHGIPEWYKELKEKRYMLQAQCVTDGGSSGYKVEQLVKEEVQRCISQINHSGKQGAQGEQINLVNSDPLEAFDRHFAFGITDGVSTLDWILDSGASIHICCNQNLMKSVKRLDKEQKVFLPDGSVQLIQFAGEVQLTADIELKNVLIAPSFTHNLVSVVELAKQLGAKCTFLDTHCLIQRMNSDTILGIAKADGKLYVINAEKGILHQTSCFYTPQQNGAVERKHRTLLQMARAVMFQNKIITSRDVQCFGHIFPYAGHIQPDADTEQPLQSVQLTEGTTNSSRADVDPVQSFEGDSLLPVTEIGGTSGTSVVTAPSDPVHEHVGDQTDGSVALQRGRRNIRPPSWTKDFVACVTSLSASTAEEPTSYKEASSKVEWLRKCKLSWMLWRRMEHGYLVTKCLSGPRLFLLLSKMGLVDLHRVHLEGGVEILHDVTHS